MIRIGSKEQANEPRATPHVERAVCLGKEIATPREGQVEALITLADIEQDKYMLSDKSAPFLSIALHHGSEPCFDGGPLTLNDTVVDPVPEGAIRQEKMVSQHTFFNCTQALKSPP